MVLILSVYVWLGAEIVNQWVPRPFAKWAVLGGGLLAMTPWAIWQVIFPLPFDMSVAEDEVTYEFADEADARDFFVLNQEYDAGEREQLRRVMVTRDGLARLYPDLTKSPRHAYRDTEDPRFQR